MEDELFKDSRGYDQLPVKGKKNVKKLVKKLVEGRLPAGKVKEAKAKMAGERNVKSVSMTDCDARFMRNSRGRVDMSYNSQLSVDSKIGIVVANEVCNDCNDVNQLQEQARRAENLLGNLEKVKLLADNGYHNGENIHFLNEKKIDAYIPNQDIAMEHKGIHSSPGPFHIRRFGYDPLNDEYTCPAGKKLPFGYTWFDCSARKTKRVYYSRKACNVCGWKAACVKSKKGFRRLKVFPHWQEREMMALKMRSRKGRSVYKVRKQTVEPVIGHIKQNLGFRQFGLRGLGNARVEWNLACAAVNVLKIWKHGIAC
jgi:transposase